MPWDRECTYIAATRLLRDSGADSRCAVEAGTADSVSNARQRQESVFLGQRRPVKRWVLTTSLPHQLYLPHA